MVKFGHLDHNVEALGAELQGLDTKDEEGWLSDG